MHNDDSDGAAAARGISTFWVELAVALCVFGFGLTVLIGSWDLGSRWTSDGPGPGYFPFYIALIMCIGGAGIFFKGLRRRRDEVFADVEQIKRVLVVLVPAAVYVFAVQMTGLYVASAVYIALFMIFLGKYSPVKSVLAAVITMTLFFLLFEVWFKVPLFKGEYNLLAFTGY